MCNICLRKLMILTLYSQKRLKFQKKKFLKKTKNLFHGQLGTTNNHLTLSKHSKNQLWSRGNCNRNGTLVDLAVEVEMAVHPLYLTISLEDLLNRQT